MPRNGAAASLQLASASVEFFFQRRADRGTPREPRLLGCGCAPPCARWQQTIGDLDVPVRCAVGGYVESEFEPGPYSQLVEGGAQVVLDHLLAGEQHAGNIFVGKTLPDEGRDLNFLGGQPITGLHGCTCSLMNMAVASFTRFRPSLMPPPKNKLPPCFSPLPHPLFTVLPLSFL